MYNFLSFYYKGLRTIFIQFNVQFNLINLI